MAKAQGKNQIQVLVLPTSECIFFTSEQNLFLPLGLESPGAKKFFSRTKKTTTEALIWDSNFCEIAKDLNSHASLDLKQTPTLQNIHEMEVFSSGCLSSNNILS